MTTLARPALGPRGGSRREFLWSIEARILALGLFLTLMSVVALGIGWLVNPEFAAARHNLPIVLSATYAAVAIWAMFFERMNEWLTAYGRYTAFGLVLAVAVAALALRGVWTWIENQGHG